MSDAALSSDSPVITPRQKYNPLKDRERMRVYMSHVRAKKRAGFQGTVKAWLKICSASQSETEGQ